MGDIKIRPTIGNKLQQAICPKTPVSIFPLTIGFWNYAAWPSEQSLKNRAINHDCFSLSCHVLFWSLQRESAKFEVWRFWNTWCQLWLSDWKSCNNIHKMWWAWPKSSLHSTLITIIPILDVSMTQVIHYRRTRQLKFEPQNLRKGVWCIIIKLHYYNELFKDSILPHQLARNVTVRTMYNI